MSARRRQLVLSVSARQNLNEIVRGPEAQSLADLPVVTSEDLQRSGFPFTVPDNVSTEQG